MFVFFYLLNLFKFPGVLNPHQSGVYKSFLNVQNFSRNFLLPFDAEISKAYKIYFILPKLQNLFFFKEFNNI